MAPPTLPRLVFQIVPNCILLSCLIDWCYQDPPPYILLSNSSLLLDLWPSPSINLTINSSPCLKGASFKGAKKGGDIENKKEDEKEEQDEGQLGGQGGGGGAMWQGG